MTCLVTEERNKDYTLEASISPTDGLIDEIKNQHFIMAKPNPTDAPQYFEIQECEYDSIGRLSLKGKHIKHCSYNNIVTADLDDSGYSDTPLQHWSKVQNSLIFPNYFNFTTDITSSCFVETGYSKADTLGRFFEELAAESSGEYHFDNFNIRLLSTRGKQSNYLLRWDKNIENPQLSLSTSDIKSHVVAFGTVHVNSGSGYDVQLCSDPYEISGETSLLNKIFMLDATERMRVKEIDSTRAEEISRVKADLNRVAAAYHGEVAGQESVNLRVDFRPRLDEMSAVGLCDTINVRLKGGRMVQAKITKTVYDSLHERWEAIELGKARMNLADIVKRKRGKT
ncbi:MAG: phage tail spike protein [Ruminococcus sp.]|nr:phage tail spike protein [Ruminococcus sp.]